MEIEKAIRHHLTKGRYKKSKLYGDGNAGATIAEILSKVRVKTEKKLMY